MASELTFVPFVEISNRFSYITATTGHSPLIQSCLSRSKRDARNLQWCPYRVSPSKPNRDGQSTATGRNRTLMHIWTRPGIRIAAAWAPSMLLALTPVSSLISHAGIALSAALTVAIAVDVAAKRVRSSINDAAERVCRRVDAATDRLSRDVLGREETYMRISSGFIQALYEAVDNPTPGVHLPLNISRN